MRKRDRIVKLKAARKLIATGWTQNVYFKPGVFDKPDCYCSIGAINKVVCGGPTNSDLSPPVYAEAEALMSHMAQAINGIVGNQRDAWHIIARFNDQAVCKQEVLDMFDKAIAA